MSDTQVQNPEPQEVGSLTEEEMASISQLRENANQLLTQLGQLELRKTRLAFQIERNEAQAQQVVSEARARLGIPETAPWQIQEDGKVVAILSETSDEGETTGEETSSEEG